MSNSGTAAKKSKLERPDIFRYQDFRAFLRAWIEYCKNHNVNFTVQKIANEAQISVSLFSLVLSGKRSFSAKSLAKLLPLLGLRNSEQEYFMQLVHLQTAESSIELTAAVQGMNRFADYQKQNSAHAKFFKYVSNWYYVAIREMAALANFKADPSWIQKRLKRKVALQNIREALEFLIIEKFVLVDENGKVSPSSEMLHCEGKVLSAALAQSHSQMFELATDSIQNTPSEQRSIEGYTLALGSSQFERAKAILQEALDKIEKLQNSNKESVERVYQVEIALFPLSKVDPNEK